MARCCHTVALLATTAALVVTGGSAALLRRTEGHTGHTSSVRSASVNGGLTNFGAVQAEPPWSNDEPITEQGPELPRMGEEGPEGPPAYNGGPSKWPWGGPIRWPSQWTGGYGMPVIMPYPQMVAPTVPCFMTALTTGAPTVPCFMTTTLMLTTGAPPTVIPTTQAPTTMQTTTLTTTLLSTTAPVTTTAVPTQMVVSEQQVHELRKDMSTLRDEVVHSQEDIWDAMKTMSATIDEDKKKMRDMLRDVSVLRGRHGGQDSEMVNECSQRQSSCGECLSQPGCVWCQLEQKCYYGDSVGPLRSQCSLFEHSTCAAPPPVLQPIPMAPPTTTLPATTLPPQTTMAAPPAQTIPAYPPPQLSYPGRSGVLSSR